MIIGAHVLIYSTDPEADRVFFRDVLEFPSIDIGRGWMIFALPPAEAAVHPSDGNFAQRHGGHDLPGALLYIMVDDLKAFVAELAAKSVACTEIETEAWGIKSTIRMPSGGEIGVYQPTHPTALKLPRAET
jgi:hypothetical protein